MLPSSLVERAFSGEQEILSGIQNVLRDRPQYSRLFDDIAQSILRRQAAFSSQSAQSSHAHEVLESSPRKKRRLDSSQPVDLEVTLNPATQTQTHTSPGDTSGRRLLLEARDLSFSLPVRKKLHFGIVQYGSSVKSADSKFSIQGRNAATNAVEFEYPSANFEYAFRLPVPEKAQKQYNFVLIPRAVARDGSEAVIWTVNHGPLKSVKIEDDDLRQTVLDSDDVLEKGLNFVFRRSGVELVTPDEKEFASASRESHRKSEVAYHVKAFRGSKEGYLFFLPTGIFFGFKKPLAFYPFDLIDSVSYTSITKRTFNLNISARVLPADDESQETEYSMLDQTDFAGIDNYIKRHQLQDASLAEARRARRIGKQTQTQTHGAHGAENEADAAADDGMTELERAQQELEDEEDEVEEDYDPDEEDGSENSSNSSDEEHEETYKSGKKRDLIAEELGSEAEEVNLSGDGDGDGDDDQENEKVDQHDEQNGDENADRDENPNARNPTYPTSNQPPARNSTEKGKLESRVSSHSHSRAGTGAGNVDEPSVDDDDQL